MRGTTPSLEPRVSVMKRALFCLLAVSLWTLPATSFADIIGPDQEACTGKSEGDPCKVGEQDGACVKGQRCRPLPDGQSSCSDIIRCEAGAAPKAEEKPTPQPDDKPAESQPDAPKPDESTPPTTEKPKQGSCAAVVHDAPAHGLWFILGLGLLVGLRRRRS